MAGTMWVLVVVAVLGILVVIAVIAGRRALTGVDPTTLSLDPALINEVRALAVSGQPGPAVKLLRKGVPGLSLVHATTMVQRMVAKGPDGRPAAPPPQA